MSDASRTIKTAEQQPIPAAEPSPASKTVNGLPTHYVGIGASAGGLEAIEAFFKNMPNDSGMAFIVVQHLSPDYKSLMVELLSKRTPMPVFRAEEGMHVESETVYLIPPKKNLTIFHGKLLLSEQDHSRGINLPIDIFLRSLAGDQQEKAVGVILSGTGSDGMRGIRAIKEAGGMVMVQDEVTAKFDGMPRSAISTGLADFVLPPEEMPRQLLSYAKHPCVARPEDPDALVSDEDDLTRIFAMLRDKNKVDFTYYKPSTVVRRIERRMTVNQIHELRDYVKYLENHATEVGNLYRELLIGVTSFFRDPQVFELLGRKWLPELMSKLSGREIRLWVPGCSTGEEAYTLAIVCRECLEQLDYSLDIKIFATDVDRDAILHAGNGVYPESIAADLSTRLLSKYFFRRDDNFQVMRNIREMVVFAQHNLIKDPPFTNIDLVSCRNLLIYLQPVLQQKVLELFNFSLNPNGILLLGTSESTGDMADYFEALDHKFKIYRSRGKRRPVDGNLQPSIPIVDRHGKMRGHFAAGRRNLRNYAEERLMDRFLKALCEDYDLLALIVNEEMEILHVLGDTRQYFQLPSGRMANDITKMVCSELAVPMATGLQKAFKKRTEIKYANIRLPASKKQKTVHLRIRPLPEKKGQEPLAAVYIEEIEHKEHRDGEQEAAVYDLGREVEQRIADLEQELQFTRENLQATIEELETANEELQATNEELLASNEELQSTNEELQSVNEELYTVNSEYQRKIIELTELNNDLENMYASTRIGTLFLDENLDIRKFTPQIARVFRIIDSDIGRPFHHLSHRLVDGGTIETVQLVQRTNEPVEKKVAAKDGRRYLMRVLPYSVGPQAYSGVVLSFIDISQIELAREALKSREADYHLSQQAANIGSLDWNPILGEVLWSENIRRVLGTEGNGFNGGLDDFVERVHPEDRRQVEAVLRSARETAKEQKVDFRWAKASEDLRWLSLKLVPEKNDQHETSRIRGVLQDITRNVASEAAEQLLKAIVCDSNDAVTVQGFDGTIQSWNSGAEAMYGYSEAEALGMPVSNLVPEELQEELPAVFEKIRAGEKMPPFVSRRIAKDGRRIDVRLTCTKLADHHGEPFAMVTTEKSLSNDVEKNG